MYNSGRGFYNGAECKPYEDLRNYKERMSIIVVAASSNISDTSYLLCVIACTFGCLDVVFSILLSIILLSKTAFSLHFHQFAMQITR